MRILTLTRGICKYLDTGFLFTVFLSLFLRRLLIGAGWLQIQPVTTLPVPLGIGREGLAPSPLDLR